jgi:threonine dehydratase
LNFEHIRRFVDDIVTVSEDEVREAMRALEAAGVKAEPSGAVTTAAVMFRGAELGRYGKAVAVMSGSN